MLTSAALWLCITVLNIFLVLKLFTNFARICGNHNTQNYWRMSGFCLETTFTNNLKRAGNAWNIAMDFVLALFPWMVIWKLNINRWEKIGLCGTMSLGILVAIISAVRQAWMDDPRSSTYDDWYFCK